MRALAAALVMTGVVALPSRCGAGENSSPAPSAPKPAAGAAAAKTDAKPAAAKAGAADPSQIEITSTKSSWDNLSELFLSSAPAPAFSEGSVFVMSGELRNKSRRPVRYVVLRYELLDENGKILQDVEGYNRSAEGMRPDEEGNTHPEEVKAIPAGGTDSYRMVFFHDEVPKFKNQRVRVTEVHEDGK
ncbi:MAG TPA: FxLYD domain-containing protein [Candidatus Binatia bacterium]